MRKLIAVACVGLALAGPALADGPGAAIRGVISDQIAAFRGGDYPTAFSYASPNIRAMFGTSENFGQMVHQGYAAVENPAATRFLGLRTEGGREVQRLMLTGPDGKVTLYDYHMIEVDGHWRIDAVTPVKNEGVGA